MSGHIRPEWLKKSAPDPVVIAKMKELMGGLRLHTVCQSAHCPNQGECFARGVVTFMILGNICTRSCTFCAVEHGRPESPDTCEPKHIVEAIKKLSIRHVVITSVTRDDLPDGGAFQFADVVTDIHRYDSTVTVEVLIPDFQGSLANLGTVADSHPDIINHNIETIPRLYPKVRPQADYKRSVKLFQQVKSLDRKIVTKSGLMLGLGEEKLEVLQVMEDLRRADCELLTLGQYLRPSLSHHEVVRFVSPVEFEEYRSTGTVMGFKNVAAAPFTRSSFQADRMLREIDRGQGNAGI